MSLQQKKIRRVSKRPKGILVYPGTKKSRKKKSVRWAVRSKLVRYYGPDPPRRRRR